MKAAECKGMPTEIFYLEDDEPDDNARAICRRCPVIKDCREYALLHEREGFWGGLSEAERRSVRRKRKIRVTEYRGGTLLPDHGECGTNAGYMSLIRYWKTHPELTPRRCYTCIQAHTLYNREKNWRKANS